LRRARVPCYLAVLKDFGPGNSAPLSFPLAGWTLALDLPRAAPGVEPLMREFDELVAGAGGRVYLSKDARLTPAAVAAMYPRLGEWQAARAAADPDGLWRSDLAIRAGLIEGGSEASAVGAGGETRRRGVIAAGVPGSAGAGGAAPRRVLLVGASEIGLAIAGRAAADGPVQAYLLGRAGKRLEWAATELTRNGVQVTGTDAVDASEVADHAEIVARAFEQAGGFDVVVLSVGVLGAQEGLDADPAVAIEVMDVNFVGTGSLLLHCMRALRDRGRGTIVVLSSVAAERPRSANAIYGAAKAGLDSLAQGLADASAGTGVRVLVVRPGFVATRMTEGLKRAPFATTPEAVADATVRALAGHAHTIWVPGVLRYVFAIIRHLPRAVFRRMPL
jgi:decaprenylphospho-beta-D-erythro-pentofuranosid-2-ulose 2-reductase